MHWCSAICRKRGDSGRSVRLPASASGRSESHGRHDSTALPQLLDSSAVSCVGRLLTKFLEEVEAPSTLPPSCAPHTLSSPFDVHLLISRIRRKANLPQVFRSQLVVGHFSSAYAEYLQAFIDGFVHHYCKKQQPLPFQSPPLTLNMLVETTSRHRPLQQNFWKYN